MRKDMNKVLIERPRHGHSRNYHEIRQAENRGELEDLPHCQGMRAPHKDRKEFSDLLGPLHRFMDGCVGRKYDDVWSEISQGLPKGSFHAGHLKGHARDMIEHQTYIDNDGEIYVRRYSRYGGDRKPDGLYVDPRDGIVYRAPNTRVSRKKQNEEMYTRSIGTFKRGEDGVYYPHHYFGYNHGEKSSIDALAFFEHEEEAIKLKGVWYWIVFNTVPPPVTQVYYDGDEKKTRVIESWRTDWIYQVKKKSGERYRCGKVQMNSRDLKHHGLVNNYV